MYETEEKYRVKVGAADSVYKGNTRERLYFIWPANINFEGAVVLVNIAVLVSSIGMQKISDMCHSLLYVSI